MQIERVLALLVACALLWVVGAPGRWGQGWPFWMQAVAAVAVLDLFTWLAHFLMHKTTWDRLFGTFTADTQLARLRYGLDGFDGPQSQSLGGLLRMPAVR